MKAQDHLGLVAVVVLILLKKAMRKALDGKPPLKGELLTTVPSVATTVESIPTPLVKSCARIAAALQKRLNTLGN